MIIIDSIKIKTPKIKFKNTVIFLKKRVQSHLLNAFVKDIRTGQYIKKSMYCPTNKSTILVTIYIGIML